MPLSHLTTRAMLAAKMISTIGYKSLGKRLYYEVARKSGWLKRRYPASKLAAWRPRQVDAICERLRAGQGFFLGVDPQRHRAEYRRRFPELSESLIGKAERIAGGELEYFSSRWHRYDGRPDWFLNPFTGQRVNPETHWADLRFYSSQYGDLKFMLEPARFALAFALVRAYWYDGDETLAEAFWRLAEDWCEQNPPQCGPLWLCGQESSFRIMAWCFALYGLAHSRHTTPARVSDLVAMIAAHADRVEGTLAYAQSQKNNHAISEAAALWTVGLLFPELEHAARWRAKGKRLLEAEVAEQIYDDGTYVQHSTNYHRLILHDLLWSVRVGQSNTEQLSDEFHERLARAVEALAAIVDEKSGHAPNLGPNDGALILPLTSCEFTDFRPVLQSAGYVTSGKKRLPPGPWDEELMWLCGPDAVLENETGSLPTRECASFPIGGLYTMHGQSSWVLARAVQYRDRPSQCDELHLDLWSDGINVACDAGSYLYNSEPPWDNALAGTSVHNTVTVDSQDQMTRAGRFLWLDWAKASARPPQSSTAGRISHWEGSHDGYGRLRFPVDHHRAVVRIAGDYWLIIDRLHSTGPHDYRLHWLLTDATHDWDADAARLRLHFPGGPYSLQMGTSATDRDVSLVRAEEDGIRGWRAPHYGTKQPALSVAMVAREESVTFWSLFGTAFLQVTMSSNAITVGDDDWSAAVRLGGGAGRPLVETVQLSGREEDTLTITA